MNLAYLRFYEELNDFLQYNKRKETFPFPFKGSPSVKDVIEANGVPHPEVDLILVNGSSVDFSYKLQNGDHVSVYPVFETINITPVVRLREKPLREVKFILDVHLGKLTKFLRLCGFDTIYRRDYDDREIISLSLYDKRIILTRDIELLKNKQVTHGYWLRSQLPEKQLKEVLLRFDLKDQISIFTRCMECNTVLKETAKEDIFHRLLPKTREYYSEFAVCPGCDRIYWTGSHFSRMKDFIDRMLGEVFPGDQDHKG